MRLQSMAPFFVSTNMTEYYLRTATQNIRRVFLLRIQNLSTAQPALGGMVGAKQPTMKE